MNTSQNSMPPDFWSPEFEYQFREDGSIIMMQSGELPAYLPTLADYIDLWADRTPTQTWIARRVNGDDWRRINYAEAREQARAIGASLLALGLGPTRPLMILSENSLEHALLGIACNYVGIPYAPVSPAYSLVSTDFVKLKEVAATLNPGAVFADDGTVFSAACAAIAVQGRSVINAFNPVDGAILFDQLGQPGQSDMSAVDIARKQLNSDTVVKYLFTSGSTGSPKAVINTNGMICSMQAMVRDCYRFVQHEPPVVLDWAPWHHTAAGNKVSYMVLTNGGSYYIDDGRPVPGKFDETLRNLREISFTWLFNVPMGWDMLVDALEQEPALVETFVRRLRMMFYAGAGMPQHTWDRLRAVGRRAPGREVLLATGYGSTETAPFAIACTVAQEKSGNIGVPCRGLILKLVPADDNWEVRLKGPSIMPGYLNEPQKTADVFDEEGFYLMGDALRAADPADLSKGFIFNGRLAENFKLSSGTWVGVGAVRAALVDAMDGLIRDAVIVGENAAELGALLWLSERGIALDAESKKRMLTEKLSAAAKLATGSSSRVCRALVLMEPPSFDRGEITDKGSLNQQALRSHNGALIERLYAGGRDVISV